MPENSQHSEEFRTSPHYNQTKVCNSSLQSTGIESSKNLRTSLQDSVDVLSCNIHGCDRYTTGVIVAHAEGHEREQKSYMLQRCQRSKTTSKYSSARSELVKLSILKQFHTVFPLKSSSNTWTGMHVLKRGSKALLTCFIVLTLVLQNNLALSAAAAKLDNELHVALQATPKPNITSALPSFITAVKREKPVPEMNVRVVRNALTPSTKSQRTNPQKRGAESFSNSHHNLQRLVTKVGGFFLEIRKSGKVKGTRKRNINSVLEFSSVRTGVVAIKVKKSGRYLAMDRKGRLVGLKTYQSSCNFYESIVENNYFVFYQKRIIKTKRKTILRQIYMGFDKNGKPKRGKKVQRNDSAAHFQKIRYIPKKKKPKRRKRPKKPKNRPRPKRPRTRKVKSPSS